MIDQSKLEELTLNVNNYVKTNIELIKLEVTEQTTNVASNLIANLLILLVGSLLLLFISLGAGFYLSNYFADNYSGFIVVAGFYFLIGLFLIIFKRNLIEKPFRNRIIYSIYSKK